MASFGEAQAALAASFADMEAALRQPNNIDAELRKLIAEFGYAAVMAAVERLEREETASG